MIVPKKLIRMARKWQIIEAKARKRTSFLSKDASPTVADKGHFVVYSSDGKRFVLPLAYINSRIFQELFRMSEEEFGLSSNGPIRMPCDSIVMEYIVSLVRMGVSESLEAAVLDSISTAWCLLSASYSSYQDPNCSQSVFVSAF